jgi:hypothetical protein
MHANQKITPCMILYMPIERLHLKMGIYTLTVHNETCLSVYLMGFYLNLLL